MQLGLSRRGKRRPKPKRKLICFVLFVCLFVFFFLQKYAPLFDQEKIGMIELPYLTEERLHKMGLPMGPRIRILQEAQLSAPHGGGRHGDGLNVYGIVWTLFSFLPTSLSLFRW